MSDKIPLMQRASDAVDRWIDEYHLVTRTDGDILYYYSDSGVYIPEGERLLSRLAEEEFHGECTCNTVKEIIGMAKRRTYGSPEKLDVDPSIICVKNGLLNIWTGELQPHSPEAFYTVQLPVLYNPEAKCLGIEKFLREVVAPEDIPLLEEIVGWLLWRPYDIHKAIMLYGAGRNGKSAFLRLLEAFLGVKNVSHVNLPKLVGDRFAAIDLVGKAANIFGDLPAKDLSETEIFKAATGGDTIRVEDKFKKAYDHRNTAKMVFSANRLPKTPDDTDGFYSRWIIIRFPNQFGTEERPLNADLDKELSTPEELSGLLNLALEALQRMKANGWQFSYRLTLEDIRDMYRRLSDPVYAFLQDCCEASEEGYVIKAVLYNEFKEYAAVMKLPPITLKKFITSMEEQSYIPVEAFKPQTDEGQKKAWLGIKLKDSHSTDSTSSSYFTPAGKVIV
jgi:putative DNA primase/helicase